MGKKKQKKKNKIGVNNPCPCGSGIKYKKCCKNKRPEMLPLEVIDFFKKQQEKQRKLEEIGVYTQYVKPIHHKNKKVWALGSTIYYNRPLKETFHEFILFILKIQLGQQWWEEQQSLPDSKRHYIFQCFIKYDEWLTAQLQSKKMENKGDMFSGTPNGWTKSLLSLSWDITSLVHKRQLPKNLLKRLKNKNEFQGARYEIAIAALFSRLNCDIEWQENIKNKSEKKFEFTATHKTTGVKIAVETKSKHRAGVLQFPGTTNKEKVIKANIKRQLKEAIKQGPDNLPFIIFIDINTPITPNIPVPYKLWINEIIKQTENLFNPKQETDLFTAIFITNFSFHYQMKDDAFHGEFVAHPSPHPKNQMPYNFFQLLVNACNYYGIVPNLDTDEREYL